MKTIITIILSLFLAFNMSAQRVIKDILFSDYEKDLRILYNPEKKEPNFYKTTAVIVAMFVINETIIRHDEVNNYKNTTLKTGIVYIAGVATATIVFSFELKKHKKRSYDIHRIKKQN